MWNIMSVMVGQRQARRETHHRADQSVGMEEYASHMASSTITGKTGREVHDRFMTASNVHNRLKTMTVFDYNPYSTTTRLLSMQRVPLDVSLFLRRRRRLVPAKPNANGNDWPPVRPYIVLYNSDLVSPETTQG